MTDNRSRDEIANANIERLIENAYESVEPSSDFSRRLHTRMAMEQQRHSAARSRSVAYRTAALVLSAVTLGFVFAYGGAKETWRVEVAGTVERLEAGSTEWTATTESFDIAPGDGVRVVDGRAQIESTGGRAELRAGSEIRAKDARSLRHLRGAIDVAATEPLEIEVPHARLRTSGAGTRIEIRTVERTAGDRSPGAPEGATVKKPLIGATVAVIAAVTIYVANGPSDSDPNATDPNSAVTIETNGGESASLREGETATISEDGVETGNDGIAKTDVDVERDPSAVANSPLVSTEGLAVIVTDSVGDPVEGATVRFERDANSESDDDNEENAGPVTATADENGVADLLIEEGSTGTIVCFADMFIEQRLPWAPPAEDDEGAEPVADGDTDVVPLGPVEIVLVEEPAIEGRVVDATSGEGRQSFLVATQLYYDQYRRDQPVVHTIKSEDGRYRVGGLRPGKYHVSVYERGFVGSKSSQVEIAEGRVARDVDFALSVGARITGRVYDKSSGAPIADAQVFPPLAHLQGSVNYVSRKEIDPRVGNAAMTDANGRFELEDLPPGRLIVRALHPDFAPLDLTIDVAADSTTEVEFAISGGSVVRGEIVPPRGVAPTDFQVIAVEMLANPNSASLTRGSIDSTGNYSIENVRSGMHVVVLVPGTSSVDGMRENTQFTMVPEGGEVVVDFILEATRAVLLGRVVDVKGDPVPLAGVMLVKMQNEQTAEFNFESTTSNSDGEYELTNLDPAKYQVSVTAPGTQNFVVVGEIEIDEPVDIERDWTLQDSEAVLTITDANGDPVSSAEAILLSVGEDESTEFSGRGLSSPEGEVRMRGLAPGEYRFWVRAEGLRSTSSKTFEITKSQVGAIESSVKLLRSAEVLVTVVDATRVPVPGALVQIAVAENGQAANPGLPPVTGANGDYLYRSLPPGNYRVTVREGARTATGTFTAVEGETATIELQFEN